MKTKLIYCSTLLLALVILFQNCAPGFEAPGSAEFASISSLAPEITISNSPSALSNIRDLSIQINVALNQYATGSDTTCRLDNAAPVSCPISFFANGLADGDHTLNIQTKDSFNNLSEPYVIIWKIDATAPVVTVNQAPPAVSGATTAIVTFSANELSTYECALDAQVFAVCTSPLTLTALSEAAHTLKIRARDSATNLSAEVTSTFRVDLTAPTITINTKPITPSNATTASFTFSGVDGAAAINIFTCQLDAQAVAICNNGAVTYNNLTEGTHTFKLKGQDSAGNLSAENTYSWVTDLTAPSLPVITPNVASPTNTNAATFQFSSTDALSGIKNYECQVDANPVETCVAGQAKAYGNLTSASHTFKVRALDQAGNISAFANFTWIVDTVAPNISVTSSVPTSTSSTSATLTIVATEAAAGSGIKTLECKIDSGAYATCTSPVNYTNLSVAAHTFMARATDNAGNQNTAAFSWTVTAVPTPTQTPTPTPTPPVVSADPTADSASKVGPSAVKTYTAGIATATTYKQPTIYYPADAATVCPCPGVVFIPGLAGDYTEPPYVNPSTKVEDENSPQWGTLLASHGFVVMFVNSPNTNNDSDFQRSPALLSAVNGLAGENTRVGSPLFALIQDQNIAVMGHSYGGGGALQAANVGTNTRIKAAIGLNPVSSYAPTYYSKMKAPTLIFGGDGDARDFVGQYNSIPNTTPKVWAQFKANAKRDMHNFARTPLGMHPEDPAVARTGLSFLKVYLSGDTRYQKFLVKDPAMTSFSSNP